MKFLISLPSTELSKIDELILAKNEVGGVVLFGKNIKSQETTKRLIKAIKNINSSLLISIDEEGGLVSRIQHFFPNLSQPYCGLISSSEVRDYYQKRSEILKSLGIDINFAPVVDIALDEESVMYKRAFGPSVEKIVELARICVEEQKKAGLISCLKHFPGHGRVPTDSHEETPYISGDSATWENIEGVIFKNLISSGVDSVMVGHLVYPDINKDVATYSSYWVNTILRQKLGFTGQVISDDMSMKGLPNLELAKLNAKLEEVNFDLVIVSDRKSPLLASLIAN